MIPDASALLPHLTFLYGEEAGRATCEKLAGIMEYYRPRILASPGTGSSQGDVILITYGDQVRQPEVPHLRTLAEFCQRHLPGVVSGIHLLPFYPSSSDDGFSVIEYRQVDPALGSWEDIHEISDHFRLMFDAVINHVSVQSEWFQGFLHDQAPFKDYFIIVEGQPDLSRVVRPRTLPLLTRFTTPSGEKAIWTTFSADQVDLNYHNPQVLLDILDTLLFYVAHGAQYIRLDAIAYLWKETGTTCIHLPQTHWIVQLIRAVFDRLAPSVQIITETNVPHAENISYFGDGENEAQMVYNFALPPLVLHTFHKGDARALSRWAAGLRLPSGQVTFFNFLASHDGIGVTPARGLISGEDFKSLVDQALAQGGLVSYRSNPDGSQSPYELNINYFDALSNPNGDEPLHTQVKRFVAAHAIMFSLVGVPGIYFHSLFGSRGWQEGVALTGRNRAINRQKLGLVELEVALADPGSLRSAAYQGLARLLSVRAAHPAFHPHGIQQVLEFGEKVFALLRVSPDGKEHVLCLHNVSAQPVLVMIELKILPFQPEDAIVDLVTGERAGLEQFQYLTLDPYQVMWLGSRRIDSQGGSG